MRLVLTAAILVALAVGGAAGAREARTSLHLYAPFGGSGLVEDVRVARTAHGFCRTVSPADIRANAYRCVVGDVLQDPCFANEIALENFVVCPLPHPGSPVLKLVLRQKLPQIPPGRDPMRYRPWAVKLANGTWCTVVTRATRRVAELRVAYRCTGGGVLLGTLRRTTATWSSAYARSNRAKQVNTVRIAEAWW